MPGVSLPFGRRASAAGACDAEPQGLDQPGEDGDEVGQLRGDVTGCGLVVHQVEDGEGLGYQAQPIVVHNKDSVVVAAETETHSPR